MTSARLGWGATAVAACSVAATPGLAAQVGATVDIGLTDVRYDGFLPSASASVTPAFRFERPWTLVSARGTYLHFQSGRHSLQGNVAAALFTRPWGRVRGEVSGTVGASRYAEFASFSHILLGPRFHLASEREGAWVGGSAGTTSFSRARRGVTTLTVGTWAERFAASWLVSVTFTGVGDTAYSDIEGAAHMRRGRLTFDGSLGVRGWSRGAGHGAYGEASVAIAFKARVAIVVSGGRYPTDPTRGSVSGRYLGVALRLTAVPPRSAPPLSVARALPLPHSPASGADAVPVTVALHPCRCAGRTLVVHAGDASSVEVSGDFTDWDPVALVPGDELAWTVTLPLAPGTYRFNIRINGGAWVVPAGVTRLAGEFGGAVGLLTVP